MRRVSAQRPAHASLLFSAGAMVHVSRPSTRSLGALHRCQAGCQFVPGLICTCSSYIAVGAVA